jgi:hypothetical protein
MKKALLSIIALFGLLLTSGLAHADQDVCQSELGSCTAAADSDHTQCVRTSDLTIDTPPTACLARCRAIWRLCARGGDVDQCDADESACFDDCNNR